ncbi:hypothetical protein SDC9_125221 [bioreactor metagenome]|uniref:Uncharacterized protein n=1 Tax=bioreactor metagenome TaxID=1076179 RepID=A0A645CMC8_9ZZZZ
MLVDRLEDAFLESTLVSASVGGVLSIDVGEVVLPIASSHMRQGKFKLLALIVDDGIEVLSSHLLVQEVQKPVGRTVDLIVVIKRESGIEVGVTPDTREDEVLIVAIVTEELGVGNEGHLSPIGLAGLPDLLVDQHTLAEGSPAELALTIAGYRKMGGERVDSLRTYPVQPH